MRYASENRRRAGKQPAAIPPQVSAKQVGVSLWPHYHIFNAFLIFLFCLHLFWCACPWHHTTSTGSNRGVSQWSRKSTSVGHRQAVCSC